MSNIKRNLEAGGMYINRFQTGVWKQRSPLFIPISAQGVQLLGRLDTLWDGTNIEISSKMTLVRRPGFPRYCSAQFGGSDFPIGFYSFKNLSGTIKAMVDTPTKLYWFNTTSQTAVFTKASSAQLSMQKVASTLYVCNGNDSDARKWDGTTVSKWGIVAPTTAPTVSLSTGSLSPLTGYQYGYAFKNSSTGHVSTMSPASASTAKQTNKNFVLAGDRSTDAQVDKVQIYRIDDGGTDYFFLAEINNPTSGTWSYTDSTPDSGLNDDILAAVDHANDPPPTGVSLVKFHMGRHWVASGNILYFAGGPDTTIGVPEEAFPPANNFTFPDQITALASTSMGLLVFTVDDAYVIVGTDLVSFTDKMWQKNFGVPSQNCVCQDGDLLFLFTSKGQVFQIDTALTEIGFPIQAQLGAYTPANVYMTLHRSGADEGLFISNGSSEVWRYSVAMGAWSTVAQPVGGVKCVSSIEVSTANYRVMMGRASTSGYILSRDTNSFVDDGSSYTANVVIGLILAPPRSVAMVNSVLIDAIPTGTYPTVSVLLNEISGTFIALPNPVPDPPELASSTTIWMKRHDLLAAQTPIPQHARHMQVQISFIAEAAQNEVIGLAVA